MITTKITSYNRFYSKDAHPYHEAVVSLKGSIDIVIEGNEGQIKGGRVSEGQACIIPAEATHDYLNLSDDNKFQVFKVPTYQLTEPESALFDEPRFLNMRKTSEFYMGFHHFLNSIDAESQFKGKVNFASLSKLVVENLDQSWEVSKLAARVSLSERQFRRIFVKDTGVNPQTWVNKLKIQKSLDLLKDFRYTITEVALLSGINDLSLFSKKIKTETGLSPSEFRKMLLHSTSHH